MAILFHEGLPRSGKSYEAMSRHIAKALRDGRPVDAYIEGIDHDKIAAAVELPVDRVRELLRAFKREDVPTMHGHVRKNALIVIDEAQNFWPTGRQRLDSATTQFITEHGHKGQDILLMGQVLSDVHKLWRGRVAMKMIFTKGDGVGFERKYNVATWKARSAEDFVKLGDELCDYDPRWFGTYASHVDESIQTGNYKDDRANLLKGWKFRIGLPAAALMGVASVGFLVWFLSGGAASGVKAPAVAAAPGQAASVPAPVALRPAVVVDKPLPLVLALNAKYRPRLAGYWQLGTRVGGQVEWYEGSELRERLSFDDMQALGTVVVVSGLGVALVGDRYVTHWPLPERRSSGPAVPALPFGGDAK